MDKSPLAEIETLISQECKLKGYSQKTIKSYLHHVNKFLASKKTPRDYLLTLIEENKSDETVRSAGFAIKFYLKTIKEESSDAESLLNDLPNVKREKKAIYFLLATDPLTFMSFLNEFFISIKMI